jgi:hypothetical protein
MAYMNCYFRYGPKILYRLVNVPTQHWVAIFSPLPLLSGGSSNHVLREISLPRTGGAVVGLPSPAAAQARGGGRRSPGRALPLPQPMRVEEAAATQVILFTCRIPGVWTRPPQASPPRPWLCSVGRRPPPRIHAGKREERRSSADLVLCTMPLEAGRGCTLPHRRGRPSKAVARHAARRKPWGGRGGEGMWRCGRLGRGDADEGGGMRAPPATEVRNGRGATPLVRVEL